MCVFVCRQVSIRVCLFHRYWDPVCVSSWDNWREINCTSVVDSFYEPGFPTEHQSLMDLLCQSVCNCVTTVVLYPTFSTPVWYSRSFISWSVTQQRPCLAITDCMVQRAVSQNSGRFLFTKVLSQLQRKSFNWLLHFSTQCPWPATQLAVPPLD